MLIQEDNTSIESLTQEERDLRAKRLEILRVKARDGAHTQQADVTSSCDLKNTAQTQYLGGFITTGIIFTCSDRSAG